MYWENPRWLLALWILPFLALLFFIPAFSLGGIPPLSGFWAKFSVVKAGLDDSHYLLVAVALLVGGFAAISVASPLASPRIFEKWFAWPEVAWLSPAPILAAALSLWLWRLLARSRIKREVLPFAGGVALFTLAFAGLAYSFFPYVVPDRITIFEAASAPESLTVILLGVVFVLPAILGYTALAYWVFRGKSTKLSYE